MATDSWFFSAFRFGSPSVGWGPTYYGGRNDIPAVYDSRRAADSRGATADDR